MTGRRGVRSLKALKLGPLHLLQRIGAWYWQHKANRQRQTRRWKSSDKSASQQNTIYYTTGTSRPSAAFLSTNCGQTWLDLTTKHPGELPVEADFNKLIRNPLNQRQFFLATSQGVYVRDPVTLQWRAFSEGLRLNEDVQDIVINTHNLGVPKLYIATRGRGFWQRAIQ